MNLKRSITFEKNNDKSYDKSYDYVMIMILVILLISCLMLFTIIFICFFLVNSIVFNILIDDLQSSLIFMSFILCHKICWKNLPSVRQCANITAHVWASRAHDQDILWFEVAMNYLSDLRKSLNFISGGPGCPGPTCRCQQLAVTKSRALWECIYAIPESICLDTCLG